MIELLKEINKRGFNAYYRDIDKKEYIKIDKVEDFNFSTIHQKGEIKMYILLIHKDDELNSDNSIIFGLSEYGKPPTLLHPTRLNNVWYDRYDKLHELIKTSNYNYEYIADLIINELKSTQLKKLK